MAFECGNTGGAFAECAGWINGARALERGPHRCEKDILDRNRHAVKEPQRRVILVALFRCPRPLKRGVLVDQAVGVHL